MAKIVMETEKRVKIPRRRSWVENMEEDTAKRITAEVVVEMEDILAEIIAEDDVLGQISCWRLLQIS